jgi:hypothetical protein
MRFFVNTLFLFVALTNFSFASHPSDERMDNCTIVISIDMQSDECRENNEENSDCKCHLVEIQLALVDAIPFNSTLYSNNLDTIFPILINNNLQDFQSSMIKPPIL